MVKHTQMIRLLPKNCFSVFGHFDGLARVWSFWWVPTQVKINIDRANMIHENMNIVL